MRQANVIVLAGQSNAVGVGHVHCLKSHFTDERIQQWYDGYPRVQINYFSHDKKSGGFVDTTVGCTEVSKETIGPELGLCEVFTRRYPEETIYIVKCAFGGTSLYKDWRSPSGWCYNELLLILKDSLRILEEAGLTPRIRGFCWMQGESDTDTLAHINQYAHLYDCLLQDFKEMFQDYLEDCVYVDGGISDVWPSYDVMNAVKREYNETHPNCFYIDTLGAGLTTRYEPPEAPDIWHYDTDSVIKLGHLFGEKIVL